MSAGPDPLSSTTGRAVVVAAVLGTALAYMSDDMLNLALPSIAREMGATVTDAQWVVNGYYVALVSFVLIAGSIGDIYGHRRTFTAGIVVFSVGALICATAATVLPLVVGRCIQGVGAAMLLAAGLALVARLTSAERRTRVVGQFLGLAAAVPAIGPFLSGALVDLLSWRWLFVVTLVMPLAALATTRLFVPETPRAMNRRPDLAGASAGLVALGGLSIGLIVGSSDPTGVVPILALPVGFLAAVWFVIVERRATDPMLPLRFFRRPVFLGGNLVWLLGSMACWGAVFFLAIALQTTLELRPVVAGLVLVPIYLVMMLGSPLAGRLAERVGPRVPILGGLGIYAVGIWLLGGIGQGSAVVPDVLLAVGVFAAGMATFSAPLAAATMSSLADSDQGIASGVNNAMGNLAGLLAVVILPAVAGLAGVAIGGPEFAAGYRPAMQVAAATGAVALVVAAITFRRSRSDTASVAATRAAAHHGSRRYTSIGRSKPLTS